MKSDNSCSCLFICLFCFAECAPSIAMHVKKKKGIAARSFIEWGRGNSVDVSYSPFSSFFFFPWAPRINDAYISTFFFFLTTQQESCYKHTHKKKEALLASFNNFKSSAFSFFSLFVSTTCDSTWIV